MLPPPAADSGGFFPGPTPRHTDCAETLPADKYHRNKSDPSAHNAPSEGSANREDRRATVASPPTSHEAKKSKRPASRGAGDQAHNAEARTRDRYHS